MWEIVSIGDSGFLEQIFIGVAMVTGNGSFAVAMTIGLMIGILGAFIQSLNTGGREIQIGHIFTCFILYSIAFVPTTTVTIEDSYTGDVRVVANVPLGVGAAGSILSSIGYNLTTLFETGYGSVNSRVLEHSFAEPLQIMNKTIKGGQGAAVWRAMDASIGGDTELRESWVDYIDKCTLPKIDSDELTAASLASMDIESALRNDHPNLGFKLILGGITYPSCQDGFQTLMTATNSALASSQVDAALGRYYSATGASFISGMTALSGALNELGMTGVSAQRYVFTSLVEPVYTEAAQRRYTTFNDVASALMVNQAIQQRNVQWGAEATIFMTFVRPMVAFIEGFVYAVTPIMAFLMMIGAFGMRIATKYLQILAWIQLWLPVLSIVNLYISTTAYNGLSSYTAAPFDSLYALTDVSHQVQNWLAMGAYMATATPVLTFILVSGSAYALTGLAQNLGGRDHIDEKIQAPDSTAVQPLMGVESYGRANAMNGTHYTGTDAWTQNLSQIQTASSSVESARSKVNTATNTFSSTLGQAWNEAVSSGHGYEFAQSIGRRMATESGHGADFVDSRAKDVMNKYGISGEHRDAVTGAVALEAGLGASADSGGGSKGKSGSGNGVLSKVLGAVGIKGQLTGAARAADSTDDSVKSSTGGDWSNSDGMKYNEKESANVVNSLAHAFDSRGSQSWRNDMSQQTSSALSKSASEVLSASSSYTESAKQLKSASKQVNLNEREMASLVEHNPEARRALSSIWRASTPEMRSDFIDRADRYQVSMGWQRSTADIGAQLAVLRRSPGMEDKYQDVMNKAFGLSDDALTNLTPKSNEGLESPDTAGVRSQANSAAATAIGRAPEIKASAAGARGMSRSGPSAAGMPASSSIIDQQFSENLGGVSGQAQQVDGAFTTSSRPAVMSSLKAAKEAGLSEAMKFYGTNDVIDKNVTGGFKRFSNAIKDSVDSLWNNGNVTEFLSGSSFAQSNESQRAEFVESARSGLIDRWSLTPAQADVLLSNYGSTGIDRDGAIENLRAQYADRDIQGNTVTSEGKPVLNQQNEEYVGLLVDSLDAAAHSGKYAPSQLTAVRHANIVERPLVPEPSVYVGQPQQSN